MLRQRVWLGGCLSVTGRYCIKTAKPILKLFRPSGSHITSDPCADTQFQYPSAGALNTRVGKIGNFRAIFDGNRRLSRKRCEICWTLIGSHGCRIEWYNFRWPWVTPNPGYKVTVYLQVEYLRGKVTQEH